MLEPEAPEAPDTAVVPAFVLDRREAAFEPEGSPVSFDRVAPLRDAEAWDDVIFEGNVPEAVVRLGAADPPALVPETALERTVDTRVVVFGIAPEV